MEPSHPSLDTSLIEALSDLERAREIASGCIRCDLAAGRTQVVFGRGDPQARLMLVGEGPGEQEDIQGRPFAGAAGRLLDSVLEEAGMSRDGVWITNVVRCRPTRSEGARVRNRPPRAGEILACSAWMDAELRLVAPRVVVCLGVIAASALIHKQFKLTAERGRWFPGPRDTRALATLHPAYVLRQTDPESRRRTRGTMVDDLKLAVRESEEQKAESGKRKAEGDAGGLL